jgi:hypothetical protein
MAIFEDEHHIFDLVNLRGKLAEEKDGNMVYALAVTGA